MAFRMLANPSGVGEDGHAVQQAFGLNSGDRHSGIRIGSVSLRQAGLPRLEEIRILPLLLAEAQRKRHHWSLGALMAFVYS